MGWSITSVEIKQRPDSTNSANVTNNKLESLSTQFFTEIGLGLIDGHEPIYIDGYNANVGTAKEVVRIASLPGLYPYLTSNTTLSVVSTDVDDDGDPVDTGARTVTIIGLYDDGSGNWLDRTDTVTMNGTTPVNTNVQFIRVNEFRVVTAGSSASNEGNITLSNGATVMATIAFAAGSGEGRAQIGIYSVGSNKNGLLCALFMSTVGGNNSHIHTRIREFGESFITERHFTLKDSAFGQRWTYGKLVGEKSDIELVAHAGGAGSEVDAGICLYIFDTP
jgi:hypothetical protein